MSDRIPEQILQSHILDVDLADPPPAVPELDDHRRRARRAWLIIRLHGEVLGLERVELPPGGLAPDAVAELLRARWAAPLREQGVLREGAGPSAPLAVEETPFTAAHARYLATAQRCSVVICTRENPLQLADTLESLVAQDHPNFAVWVIDSAPRSSATAEVAARFTDRLEIRHVVEPRPGLSRARNRALAEDLDGDVVAWLDDDELADPLWLSELCRSLAERPDASGVSGVVVPGELATPAQAWFEQFGGHSKGRGFSPAEFSPATRRRQSPLYPLPAFGVGANMAFRTQALREIGGFDPALGAGTRTHGGEDTLMFSELLRRGATTLYRPTALTRHFHRRDEAGLRRQMIGYGTGLTAFYTALIVRSPELILPLAALGGRAVRDLVSPHSLRSDTLEADFPRELMRENRRGMLRGPAAYLRQRREDRRATR